MSHHSPSQPTTLPNRQQRFKRCDSFYCFRSKRKDDESCGTGAGGQIMLMFISVPLADSTKVHSLPPPQDMEDTIIAAVAIWYGVALEARSKQNNMTYVALHGHSINEQRECVHFLSSFCHNAARMAGHAICQIEFRPWFDYASAEFGEHSEKFG